MFPKSRGWRLLVHAFLCLRRGVSTLLSGKTLLAVFSLPTQRCFHPIHRRSFWRALFSAYAEVFPGLTLEVLSAEPFLCLRRGVSSRRSAGREPAGFSLPTQRCFWKCHSCGRYAQLFSAYAEVFLFPIASNACLDPFLCLRRGVSKASVRHPRRQCFSLPTQRCFPRHRPMVSDLALFSAYAEVFPRPGSMTRPPLAFLCLRRGVSV